MNFIDFRTTFYHLPGNALQAVQYVVNLHNYFHVN